MEVAELVTKWPAMKVRRVGPLHWRTADEPATGQLTFADGTGVYFSLIDLPETEVHIHPLEFPTFATVDACVAEGEEPEGKIVLELDKEPVVFDFHSFGIIAKAMPAKATYTAKNGDIWVGHGMFPESKFTNGMASAVTASFVLSKVS